MERLTLFERIGGLGGARALADCFYDVMERDLNARTILRMHPSNLHLSRKKLYLFIVEWFGGPELFGASQVNQPWLRLRHQHLAIGESERNQWLSCMKQAMIELQYEPQLLDECLNRFFGAAEYIRNQ